MKVILTIDSIKYPLTGIGRYTYELAQGLRQLELDELIFLQGIKLKSELPRLQHNLSQTQTPTWWKQLIRSNPNITTGLREINQKIKGYAINGKNDFIFHGTNFQIPRFSGKSVVTIHDLSPFLWPDHHPPERVHYMQSAIQYSLKNATAIITDTQHTKHEIASYFSFPIERIHAVFLASGIEFRPHQNIDLKPILDKFGIQPNGYTLFTGTVEPRKNLGVLINAYEKLPLPIRRRWPLVIAGHHGWRSEVLHARLATAEQQGWLKYLGFVPQDVLPALMAGARLFTYPSLYEGFGLPILEAMASGTPVICSNASTLPEVAGDAAAFHNPYDVDELMSLVHVGLENEDWRNVKREAGLKHAKNFSWRSCAQQTLNVYKAISNT